MHIPPDILHAYYAHEPKHIKRLTDDMMINHTFAITGQDGSRAILQRLHHIFTPAIMDDVSVFMAHLHTEGLPASSVLPTRTGTPYATDTAGYTWRSFTYIDNQPQVDVYQQPVLQETGALLARFHRALRHLDYRPVFSIPHFHDTAYFADELRDRQLHLSHAGASRLARQVLAAYKQMDPLPVSQPQLIHADARMANLLFRDGLPYTYIDLDTIMHGSIWIDIGDAIRSISENAFAAGYGQPRVFAQAFISGYCQQAAHNDAASFESIAIRAARWLSLEVAMRALIDVVDDHYFGWNANKYASRQESNLALAATQWRVYKYYS